ncbi:hypothetical protein HY414_02000, partial [Candidatus Kaiserbacteria bacterium]|nr:hypothetical protein [Candidatus Kaiserbacteria bacterium]
FLWKHRLLLVLLAVAGFYAWQFSALPIPEAHAAFTVDQSLRFNDDDLAYLNKTPASEGTKTKWTYSAWIKRGNLSGGTNQYLLEARVDDSNVSAITLCGTDCGAGLDEKLSVVTVSGGSTIQNKKTTGLYRDPAEWLHIVVAVDTTQATAANRNRVYVDGTEITSFSTDTNITQDAATFVTDDVVHSIGRHAGNAKYFDGYMSDIYLIDGQQLTPSSFGETDSNGYWRPKSYTGTYGTNGFHLDFASGSDLGNDVSGNNNDWTVNNLNAMDKMIDTPTNSFATLSPVDNPTDCVRDALCASPGVVVTSDGNLKWVGSGTINEYRLWDSTIEAPADNRYYFEARVDGEGTVDGDGHGFNVAGCNYSSTNFVSGDYLGFAVGTSSIYVRKNGTWQNSASESDVVNGNATNRCAARSGGNISNLGDASATTDSYISGTMVFGQTANPTSTATTLALDSASGGYFQYTAPSGYKALSTSNFPEPAVTIPKNYFDAKTYSGTGASQSITGLSFQPDVAWIKNRTDAATAHAIFDAVRGLQKFLSFDAAAAEDTDDTQSVTSFDTTGFTLGTGGSTANVNTSAKNYVSWNWKESTTAGFDIVTYTGDNTANRNISHDLGRAPDFAIIKRRDTGANTWVWHNKLTSAAYFLEMTSDSGNPAQSNTNTPWGTGNWSATQFMVTNDATNNANASGGTYVAYLFASTTGMSAFGSYTGNGAADGPFVYTGFKPRWILIKNRTSLGSDYRLVDTARDTYNPVINNVRPNEATAEDTTSVALDALVNGFKLRDSQAPVNESGSTFVYAAFAEIPFKYSAASAGSSSNAKNLFMGMSF